MALAQSHLTEYRTLLGELSAGARADLRALLAGVDMTDGAAIRRALGPTWVDLVATYGSASAALGAVLFEAMADDLAVPPRVELAPAVEADQADARMRWASTTIAALGNLSTVLDELVKQPARSTVEQSAHASGGAWMRVPQGRETCAFCRMIASRGPVYGSELSALAVVGRGKTTRLGARGRRGGGVRARGKQALGDKYHGGCDCAVVFVNGPDDYPAGYDPDVYLDEYLSVNSTDTKTILAGMRANAGSH